MNTRAPALTHAGRVTMERSSYPKSLYVAALFLTVLLLPFFQVIVGYHITRVLLPLWLLWAILLSLESETAWPRMLSHRRLELGLFTLWCSVLLLYAFANPKIVDISEAAGFEKLLYCLLPTLMCYLMAMTYETMGEWRAFRFLILWLMVGMAISSLIFSPALFSGELAVRENLINYQDAAMQNQDMSFLGLGSLGFYGSMAIMIPFFINLIMETKGLKRGILIALLIPILINLYLTSLLIILSTLALTFGIYILLVMTKFRSKKKYKAGIIFVVIIAVFLVYKVSEEYSFGYQVSKVEALLNQSGPHVVGDTSAKRYERYMASLEIFLAYPLLGAGGGLSSEDAMHYWLGGHSGVFDVLGLYGSLAFVYFFFLLIKFRQLRALMKKYPRDTTLVACMASMAGYFLLILLDPLLINAYLGGTFFFFLGGLVHPLRGQGNRCLPKPLRNQPVAPAASDGR
jgi:hypothetical protein